MDVFVHQKYLFVRETWVQFGQGDDDAVAICGLPSKHDASRFPLRDSPNVIPAASSIFVFLPQGLR
jgi:hypothetical protein